MGSDRLARPQVGGARVRCALALLPLMPLLPSCLGGCAPPAQTAPPPNTTIALVQTPVPLTEHNPDSKIRLQFFNVVADALRRSGVAFRTLGEQETITGGLSSYPLAIFPYVSSWDHRLEQAALRYVRSGGKIIACHGIPVSLASALGVQLGAPSDHTPRPRHDRCRMVVPGIGGAPQEFIQHSWNVFPFAAQAPRARPLYLWCDPNGAPAGGPAVALSETGAYMGHVLTKTDREAKAALLVALVAHFVPGTWRKAAHRAITDVGRVGRVESLAQLRALVAAASEDGRAKGADDILKDVEDLVQRAAKARDRSDFPRAIHLAMQAHRLAGYAYVRTLPTRECELRGVWLHSPAGISGWDWDQTVRNLSRMGYNALFVNVASGSEAAFPTKLLPLMGRARGQDQLAQCVAACRKYGVECHAWVQVFYLGRAAPATVQRLQAEGRLQLSRRGETLSWLCPSDPRNVAQARALMGEIVRNYGVQGVHLDYIRYANTECCYCPQCRGRFEKLLGRAFARWPDELLVREDDYRQYRTWRRGVITDVVKAVGRDIKGLKPHVRLSAAVMPTLYGEAYQVGQDWLRWVQEGYINFLCPMNYGTDKAYFRRLTGAQVRQIGGEVPLYAGLGSWLMQDVTQLGEQMQLARELGADGYVVFHYDDPTLIGEWMPELRNGPAALNAVTPHSSPATGLRYVAGTRLHGDDTIARAGEPFTVAAWVPAGAGVSNARLRLESLDGTPVSRASRLYPDRRREVRYAPEPGDYRPAILGRVGGKPFTRRGRIVHVLAPQSPPGVAASP